MTKSIGSLNSQPCDHEPQVLATAQYTHPHTQSCMIHTHMHTYIHAYIQQHNYIHTIIVLNTVITQLDGQKKAVIKLYAHAWFPIYAKFIFDCLPDMLPLLRLFSINQASISVEIINFIHCGHSHTLNHPQLQLFREKALELLTTHHSTTNRLLFSNVVYN